MTFQTFEKFVLLFLIFSIFGWVYETILVSIEQKKLVNRGFLNGPYCPIYGWGAIVDILVLGRLTNPFALFFLGALLCCSLEYATSYIMEKLFHTRWWDYSNRKFNIKGRVCLIGAVVFGTFSTLFILFVYPFAFGLLDKIPTTVLHVLFGIGAGVYIIDNIVTFSGFAGFTKKLKAFGELIEEKFDEVSEKVKNSKPVTKIREVYASFAKKFNLQQRRMMRAFPKMKSVKYDSVLDRIKEVFSKNKKSKDLDDAENKSEAEPLNETENEDSAPDNTNS